MELTVHACVTASGGTGSRRPEQCDAKRWPLDRRGSASEPSNDCLRTWCCLACGVEVRRGEGPLTSSVRALQPQNDDDRLDSPARNRVSLITLPQSLLSHNFLSAHINSSIASAGSVAISSRLELNRLTRQQLVIAHNGVALYPPRELLNC